jgi:hypothetical protein
MARDGSLSAIEPYKKAAAVSPHDSDTFPVSDALWVGTGATELTVTINGADVLFGNVPDGSLLHIACTAVKNTGTDASDIVRLNW